MIQGLSWAIKTCSDGKQPFAEHNGSIDMLRGLTMLLMVFVNDLWSVTDVPHFLEHFSHGEDGMGVADAVFPMFLFAMGMLSMR